MRSPILAILAFATLWGCCATTPFEATVSACRGLDWHSLSPNDSRAIACQWAAERCYVDGEGCDEN